jgi:prophage regulatory protein
VADLAHTQETAMRLLKLDEVCAQLDIARATLYLWMDKGHFPKQIKIGEHKVRWLQRDVDDYIEKCIAERDKK